MFQSKHETWGWYFRNKVYFVIGALLSVIVFFFNLIIVENGRTADTDNYNYKIANFIVILVLALFSEMSAQISFIFGIMIRYYGCLMHLKLNLALCQNRVMTNVHMTNAIILVCPQAFFRDVFTDFIHIYTVIMLHVIYSLALCQSGVIMTSLKVIDVCPCIRLEWFCRSVTKYKNKTHQIGQHDAELCLHKFF